MIRASAMNTLEIQVLTNIIKASEGNTETPVAFLQYGVSGEGPAQVADAIKTLAELGYVRRPRNIRRPPQGRGAVFITPLGLSKGSA